MVLNISEIIDLPSFKVEGKTITLNITDATHASEAPPPTSFVDYILVAGPNINDLATETREKWLQKLGLNIANNILVVGVIPGKDGLIKKVKGIGSKKGVQYYLDNFPDKYAFYVKIRGVNAKKTSGKPDAYLLGNGKIWRSPNEFIPHLAWLVAGKPLQYSCMCIRCTSDNLQEPINKEIKKKLDYISSCLTNAATNGLKRPKNALNLYPYFQKPYRSNGIIAQLGDDFIQDYSTRTTLSQPNSAQVKRVEEPAKQTSSEDVSMDVDEEEEDALTRAKRELWEKDRMDLAKIIIYNKEEFFKEVDSEME